MNYEHTQNLSNDLSNLLNDTSNYDAKVRVGKEPNIKEFRAHSLILSSRSIYFKRVFSPQWAKIEDGFFISNQPNISPPVFEILMKYIYSGKISIDNEISLVDILIASDELELLEVYRQLKKRLVENESAWKLPEDFITLCRHHDRFANLYEVAIELVCKIPRVIFESKEFLLIEEDNLIRLLKCDDLKLEEIEIWDYLVKWGIENTDSTLDEDLTKWMRTDFMELEKTLHNCIPYIRFSQMSPKVYNLVRAQFKSIIPADLDDDVLQYFSDPNSKPSLRDLPLRVSVYPFDSEIINAKDAALIASWIDNKKEIPYRLKDVPFKFELIYRASLEEFKDFHYKCDNKGPTVVIIKVRNSGEIIGGYNPLGWCSIKPADNENLPFNDRNHYIDHRCETSKSFIFSLFSLTNGVIPILSRVSSKEEAIIWCKNKGPCFGLQDLWIQSSSRRPFNNIVGKSKQKSYEKKIINEETFEIEDYEVFQIIDKRTLFIIGKKAKLTMGFLAKMVKLIMSSLIKSIMDFLDLLCS